MEQDRELDRLFETLSIEKVLVPALTPPPGGYTGRQLKWMGYQWNAGGHDICYFNGQNQKHRLFGPAYISTIYDIEIWYKEGLYHRLDGPAIRHKNNFLWYKEGRLHRLDGPAVVELGGPKQFWIDGVKYNPKEYKKEIARRHRKGSIK